MNLRTIKIFYLLLTFLLSASFLVPAYAQDAVRAYTSHKVDKATLVIETNDGRLAITPYSEKIIEVIFLEKDDRKSPDTSWSVVKAPENLALNIEDLAAHLLLKTAGISIEINKKPLQLRYAYKDKQLINEHHGYFTTKQGSGFDFTLEDDEVIYGGGARALPMDRRGYELSLYNTPAYGYAKESKDMYYSLPLVMSSKQYMILYDNPARGRLDIGKKNKNILSMQAEGGRKAYYLIAGDSFLDLSDQYTQLTGRQPLPPRWLLGNISSRFGYRSQAQAEMTVRKYREKHVPVDAMVIDLFWFGKEMKGTMGNLAWDKNAWPQPQKMMRNFAKQNVNTVLISEPFIVKTSKRWQEAVDADILTKTKEGEDYVIDDFFFGAAGLLDIFKPKTQDWLWNIYKDQLTSGVDALWGDLGEPEKHPDDMIHVNGAAPLVHNVYGHQWAKLVFDGYRKDYPARRHVTLMRAGFAGSQRYGMVPWTGDVSRNWEGLSSQPAMTMQMGMQGLAYMHSDLGGFAPDKRDDGTVFADPMLYLRWLQYGVFQPVFRPHSHESSPPEPVFWREPILTIAREAVNLRYRLLPYNYSLAFENATQGYPLMRPLFFNEPTNRDLLTYSTAYLWGENILVAPILKAQQTEKEVYFPSGSNWLDFYQPSKMYRGGSKRTIAVSENNIPTFIRSGSFLPMFPLPKNSDNLITSAAYSSENLEILYFIDTDVDHSQFTLFDDDGSSKHDFGVNSHEKILLEAHFDNGKQTFRVSSNGGHFDGRPEQRHLKFIIGNVTNVPEKIVIDNERYNLSRTDMAYYSSAYYSSRLEKSSKTIVLNEDGQLSIALIFEQAPVTFSFNP